MAEVKKKMMALSGEVSSKSSEGGERRVRFVASSVNRDRHYEQVDVASLRLPLKQGGSVKVEAIGSEGIHDLVDIPLMLNHSMDVCSVIGSVRSAFYEKGELIFEAGISKREIAQEMLILLDEGHLNNAFSITMSDYDYNFESETISNAEVIEVSLVFRGSNKEARLLAIKSLESEKMAAEEVKQEENKEEKMEKHKQILADDLKEAVPTHTMKSSVNYLETREAMNDYAKILEKFAGAGAGEVKKAWAEFVSSKGITNVDVLLPGAMVSAISDGIAKSGTIWNVLNKTGLTVRRIDAETAGARAQGHKRGTNKKEASLTFTDRVIRAGFIYDYLTLNKEDIVENRDTGALVKFVLETLPKRIITEIERAVVIGDGRSGDDDNISSFVSILADAKTGTFATEYAPASGEPLYKSIVKAAAEIVAEGDVYLVMSKSAKADLKLSETKNGGLVFPLGGDIAGTLEVKEIFTPSWFNSTNVEGHQAVMFVAEAYETVGDNSIEAYTNFALSTNKQEYLQEIYAGGALAKVKAGVAIKNAA